ncbi:MAG: hypothetical protein K2N33_05845, partial [Clostridia bacterium]|nr:hypothetical protein [Clostridia bacterium]
IGKHSDTPYGMVVEVKVEKNIITSIKNITNTDAAKDIQTYKDVRDGVEAAEATYHAWTVVSPGWEDNFNNSAKYWALYTTEDDELKGGSYEDGAKYYKNLEKGHEGEYIKWDGETLPDPAATKIYSYGWTNANASEWSDHESWLMQQYVGWSVADVLAINVYTDYGYALTEGGRVLDKNSKGEPYKTSFNSELSSSGLLVTGATQGSGRLLLAVQNALSK